MTFNLACIGSAIAALITFHAVPVQGSVDAWIENGTQPVSVAQQTAASVSPLQQFLDDFCKEKFSSLCTSGQTVFCGREAVARYGTGLESQKTNQWRCYDEATIASNQRHVQCVDSCGNLFPCYGAVGASPVHSTVHDDVQSLIERESARFCSPQQRLVDTYCRTQRTQPAVARKDSGLDSQSEPQWRCYDVSSLVYEKMSTCVDYCGQEIQCHGGRTEGRPEHSTRNTEISQKITQNTPNCPVKRPATEVNSPQSQEKPEPTPEATPEQGDRGMAQDVLDKYCQSKFIDFCEETGDPAYCNKTVVARKQSGREVEGFPNLYSEPQWRCFSVSEMSSENNSLCIDNCGAEVSCKGVKDAAKDVYITRPDVADKILDAVSQHCQRS